MSVGECVNARCACVCANVSMDERALNGVATNVMCRKAVSIEYFPYTNDCDETWHSRTHANVLSGECGALARPCFPLCFGAAAITHTNRALRTNEPTRKVNELLAALHTSDGRTVNNRRPHDFQSKRRKLKNYFWNFQLGQLKIVSGKSFSRNSIGCGNEETSVCRNVSV